MSALDELRQVVGLRRREIGLSQARVAVLSGLSRQALSRIETGAIADLGIDKVERLAQTLGFKLRIVESKDWYPRTHRPGSGRCNANPNGETMSTMRILIPDAASDGGAIRTAFQCLVGLMAEDAGIRRCLLLIPTKGNIQSTMLEQVLGGKASKLLSDGKEVRLGEGALRLETIRTFKPYTPGDAVVVVYADQKMMDAVDSNRSLKAVICVPHLPDAVDDWKRTWNPISPDGEQAEVRLIGNPVVEAALVSTTGRINLGHRVLHPSDTEAVKDAFRILRAHRQTEDPANIRAWCIKHGWHAGAADEAMKYAAKAFALRSKPNVQGTRWASDIYEQWARAAAGTSA